MSTPFVTRLDEEAGRRLYEELGHARFAFRAVPHARWSARGEETTVTWYRSGKLVVQGRGAEAFVARRLPGVAAATTSRQERIAALRAPELGSDESGKGDYFGPLAVAATLVRPGDVERLSELGVQDSKAVGDETIRRLEGALSGLLPHAVRVLDPPDYNRAREAEGNVNHLLGRLHAEVIEALVPAARDGGARIVVDRFGAPDLVRRHLGAAARRLPFVMPERGERHPAVAAASLLARAAFLRGFGELEGLAGGTLPRGASDPRIVTVGRRLLREGGREWLGRFAKLHFRTTRSL